MEDKLIKDLSIYVHIPFCVRKCNYCDFLSYPAKDYTEIGAYVDELCESIASYKEKTMGYLVRTVFIGGGTPSILTEKQINKIMDTIMHTFHVDKNAEITMESNPGTIDLDKLKGFRKAGINRLSIGAQSCNNEELKLLGRIHNYTQLKVGFDYAREAGFDNINIDIMWGIPKQTVASYGETMGKIMALEPEHISAYSLILEEGTPFYNNEEILDMLPMEEEERKMYQYTLTVMRGHGYDRYEISNFAKPGYECKHNKVYWTGGEYLGFGYGAASYFGGYRFQNERAMKAEEKHLVTKKEQMEEFMFLGLRMTDGIKKSEFLNRFGEEIYNIYEKPLRKHLEEKLLVEEAENIRLSKEGISLSNYVLADFLLEEEEWSTY